ncbi:MAG: adenosine deaminase [Candidatus Limnocylindria bacterium]
MALVDELRPLPKAELHQHLDGALRPDTAVELAAAVGMPLTIEEARKRMVGPERCRDQAELLGYFDLPLALLQTAESLERAAAELVEDMRLDGVRYAEVRWAPRLHLERGLSVASVISAVASGVARASAHPALHAPVVALIVTAMRSHPPSANVQLAESAAEFGWPVVGFDLAGPEAQWPAPPHAAAFDAAREAGLGLTAHAGEVPGPQRIAEVLEFRVTRIAHGVTAAEDESIVALLRERDVTLDMCPTSNVQTGIAPSLDAHPVARLHRAGVSVTISTDDRTVSSTTLSQELARTAEALALTDGELSAIALNAFRRAFAPPAVIRPVAAAATRAWGGWGAGRVTG